MTTITARASFKCRLTHVSATGAPMPSPSTTTGRGSPSPERRLLHMTCVGSRGVSQGGSRSALDESHSEYAQ